MSKKRIVEYAKVLSEDKISFFINSKNDKIFAHQKGRKNVFEITEFNKDTGELGDVQRSFVQSTPLNFLSPSFDQYIYIEQNSHKIKVRNTKRDDIVCTLPQHFNKYLLGNRDHFSYENLVDKIFFVEDNFILLELDKTNEIIFHVPT